LGISVVERIYGGYFGGGTTKIPPYLPLTPAIPREVLRIRIPGIIPVYTFPVIE
jgi:hypothetical protein